MWFKHLLPLFLLVLAACSDPTPQQLLRTAQDELARGAHAEAAAAATRGLAQQPADTALRWRLELVRLEAQARGGDAPAALATLERLASAGAGAAVDAGLYLSTADQLRTAGQGKGAVELLDAGAKRFPEDARIAQAIARTKEKGSDAELDALRSLGYLE